MAPQIVNEKAKQLLVVLVDLEKWVGADREDQNDAHYEIERQIQLAVDISLSIARRIIVLKGLIMPETAREVFLFLGKKKVIPAALAKELGEAVGLRNLLVHEYGELDYDLLFNGLESGYKAFLKFSKIGTQLKRQKT